MLKWFEMVVYFFFTDGRRCPITTCKAVYVKFKGSFRHEQSARLPSLFAKPNMEVATFLKDLGVDIKKKLNRREVRKRVHVRPDATPYAAPYKGPAYKVNTCNKFAATGRCRFGRNCRYAHVQPGK